MAKSSACTSKPDTVRPQPGHPTQQMGAVTITVGVPLNPKKQTTPPINWRLLLPPTTGHPYQGSHLSSAGVT